MPPWHCAIAEHADSATRQVARDADRDHSDDNLWRVLINGTWRIVPPDKVRPYPTPDGNSHVCETDTQGIMCFVGGKPKS